MRIIVSDTSCMIDLRKAALLEALLALPFTFVMPSILFEDEWLDLGRKEKRRLQDLGLEVRDLPGPMVERAARYANRHRRLKLNDCFALALAEDIEDSILLTGDRTLRRVAERKGQEVRGVGAHGFGHRVSGNELLGEARQNAGLDLVPKDRVAVVAGPAAIAVKIAGV